MITIRGLAKSFGARPVLRGIDVEVEPGRIIALLGASGSGKSTLLRCLNGLETFDAGSIEIAGHRLSAGARDFGMLQRVRSSVGMVFQEFHLFPHLTVLENLTLAPRVVRREPAAAAETRALDLLASVGLGDRAGAYPAELSGGQKQRVAIVRALAQGVSVLLLDEPTSALDPEMREEVREVLRSVARGVAGHGGEKLTLLLVTHERRLATELADELWLLENGAIVERGAPSDIAARPKSNIAREFFARS